MQHQQTVSNNYSAYPTGDSHPITAGHQKATAEFIPWLNVFYHRWQAGLTTTPAITLTVPNGGELWPINTDQQIRWATTGIVTQVNLYYALNSVTTTIETNVVNTGVYTWATLARVRVESVVSPTTVYDVSSANFTLCVPGNCAYWLYLPIILK